MKNCDEEIGEVKILIKEKSIFETKTEQDWKKTVIRKQIDRSSSKVKSEIEYLKKIKTISTSVLT